MDDPKVTPIRRSRPPTDRPPGTEWRADLATNKEGKALRTLANVLVALRSAPEWQGIFGWNQLSHRVTLLKELPSSASHRGIPRELGEADISNATVWMQENGIVVASAVTSEGIRVAAEEHPFHPVREYLQSLAWDNTPRIDHWTSDHLGAADTTLHRAFASRWLIGMIARIMQPGCQFDTALILESRQGFRKSTALRVLAEPWFTDHVPDLTHKDALEQLQGIWLVELAELASFSRAETQRVKAFLTTRVDRFRPSFGRIAADHERQCGFAGTINPGSNGYLRDETGARRFWIIACGTEWDEARQVNTQALCAVRDQLWAEALVRYRAHEPWWLDTNDLEAAQTEAADDRLEGDALEDRVRPILHGKPSIAISDILGQDGLRIPDERWTKGLQTQIGFILSKLKWRPRRTYEGEGKPRTRRYFPPDRPT